jgi:hypothetical protein
MVQGWRPEAGFLIWGRARSSPKQTLPSKSIKKVYSSPKFAEYITPKTKTETSSLYHKFENDKVLDQFSGEPQIVESLTICQLTSFSRADPGYLLAPDPPQLSPTMATTSDQLVSSLKSGSGVSAGLPENPCLSSCSLCYLETLTSRTSTYLFFLFSSYYFTLSLLNLSFTDPPVLISTVTISQQRFVEVVKDLQDTPSQ